MALCDLGANINFMSLSEVKKLNLRDSTLVTPSLQMANMFLTCPKGIIEDALVKSTSSYSKVDFMVLDMEEDREVPLILGRAFLATGQALIDAENWELTLHVDNEKLCFDLYQCMTFLDDEG